MKRFVAIVLALVMVLSFAACKQQGETPSTGDTVKVDMSKYPADLNEWSNQNFVDYFTQAGVFTAGTGRESWVQDHATYWANTPFNECAGYWNEEGSIMIMIFTFKPDNPDTTADAVKQMQDYIKQNHKLTEDYSAMPIDHLVGNVAFSYSSTADEDVYNAMDAAYNQLIKDLGATADF